MLRSQNLDQHLNSWWIRLWAFIKTMKSSKPISSKTKRETSFWLSTLQKKLSMISKHSLWKMLMKSLPLWNSLSRLKAIHWSQTSSFKESLSLQLEMMKMKRKGPPLKGKEQLDFDQFGLNSVSRWKAWCLNLQSLFLMLV